MKRPFNLYFFILLLILFEGCNTLYNSKTINIEVYKPGKIILPPDFKNVAVRYNNTNVSLNSAFAKYLYLGKTFEDTTNTDSIAAEIYFQAFANNLRHIQFFDSVTEISQGNYTGNFFIDLSQPEKQDSLREDSVNVQINKIQQLGQILTILPPNSIQGADTVIIHPELGIYTHEQLSQIADSTRADLLISLDYFGSIDVTDHIPQIYYGQRYVLSQGIWNLYDLQHLKLVNSINRIDTVSWDAEVVSQGELTKMLPPRKDAILNAAEISGAKIAELIVPHWSEDERIYYSSGHVDMVKAEAFIKEEKWVEAAKLWKANITNPNKKIMAKCMFNMGLACEMAGDLDAAIDWVVRSFQIFGQDNEFNAENCTQYIKILGTRKLDLKRIDYQLNPNTFESTDTK